MENSGITPGPDCPRTTCSACGQASDAIRGQYVLRLREGGEVIIRGATVIDARELERIQGWVAQQLIIQQNSLISTIRYRRV